MARVKVSYDDAELRSGVQRYYDSVDEMLKFLIEYHSMRGTEQMKVNAPWTDRTSAARNGLFSVTEHEGSRYTIIMSHTVHYGIWLEVKFSGRDAVIMPTILSQGKALMSDIQKRLA